jgi:chorismate--pyruvate lyase
MSCFDWRTRLPGRGISPVLRSWLTEPGSLTARCQALCSHFSVQLLHYGFARPLADEGGGRSRLKVREVLLACDGVPVIFAHTTLCTVALSNHPAGQSRGRLSRWLARLGSRSLGSLLFAHPGFTRGEIEYCRLDARHSLFQRVTGRLGNLGQPSGPLWARRSRHSLGGQTVMVTEVFLPAIELL